MKKQLFLLFSLLFLGSFAFAQIDISVNGVVVDPVGNPVPNVTVYVETDSTPVGAGYFNTLTTAADGSFTDLFQMPSAASQGVLFVTMVNCAGQQNITQTNFWNPGNTSFAYAFVYCDGSTAFCDASIGIDSMGAVVVLVAESAGVAPYTYEWNTGQTSQTIPLNGFGTYCVTITDAIGCVDEACFVNDPPPPCGVSIVEDQVFDGLIASSTGTAPYTYAWNTGETTASIFPITNGNYCVTITDATGCTDSDCYVYVVDPVDSCSVTINTIANPGGSSWELSASSDGEPPFNYQWSTGQNSATITTQIPGDYCVTITDASGCIATDCVTITGSNSCEVTIEVTAFGDLGALAIGAAPFMYTWNTGETTQTIQPLQGGTYCVTITSSDGCTASDCFVYVSPCSVSFTSTAVGNNAAIATATATGAAPFSYQWDTGEQTESILVTISGMYCVTMADANGCTAIYCDSVYVDDPDNNLISGQIFLGDATNVNTFVTGQVYLIVHDDQAGTLTAIDTVGIAATPANPGGYYSFGSVPDGDYLVKVALDPNTNGYAENLPTYYGDVLYWDQATTITTPYMGTNAFDITTVAGVNPGGPGFIGGLITDGANLWSGGSERGDDPIAGVSVLLLNESEEPVTHTGSDVEGKFSFDNLAWGTYKLVVEIWGIPQGEKWVTIGPDNPSIADVEFEITDTSINTNTNEVSVVGTLVAHPNPVQNMLTIALPATEVKTLEVVNVAGQVVEVRSLHQTNGLVQLSTNHWQTGWYLIRVTGVDGVYLTKVAKQ